MKETALSHAFNWGEEDVLYPLFSRHGYLYNKLTRAKQRLRMTEITDSKNIIKLNMFKRHIKKLTDLSIYYTNIIRKGKNNQSFTTQEKNTLRYAHIRWAKQKGYSL